MVGHVNAGHLASFSVVAAHFARMCVKRSDYICRMSVSQAILQFAILKWLSVWQDVS